MTDTDWNTVDDYFVDTLLEDDPILSSALAASDEGGLPPIAVSPLQGRLLNLLARSLRARRILELGTLGGYSTIWLGRALELDGRVVSAELDPHHAEVARSNLARAGLADRVDVRVGPAADTLRALGEERADPFDLVFIDADKGGYREYFELTLPLVRVGSVIVADNVVRQGEVARDDTTDAAALGIRAFLDRVAREPRVEATVIQTVGAKGHDGFAFVAVVS